ncbi:hypothetical protein CBR_g16914 [Chara braunii]|uniref:non-specific serine/threonine protein kinase n=1 Tax=Chara braunii TaxID=69332 RepID=A0A388KU23_CHABU|nr:hypothetical protein CBR_g16914 [Chara braunii]|eukprot:GBG73570.1 hypothetical protein CBR_g16914 [Chara braunii]
MKVIAKEQAAKKKKLEEETKQLQQEEEERMRAAVEEEVEEEEQPEEEPPRRRRLGEGGESSGAKEDDPWVEKRISEWVANLSLGEDEEAMLYIPQEEKEAAIKEIEATSDRLERQAIENEKRLDWKLLKKDAIWKWDKDCTSALKKLKRALIEYLVLKVADPSLSFVVTTNASQYGIGTVLQQNVGNGYRPVEFMSARMPSEKVATSTYERELRQALEHWKLYLLGRHFKVYSNYETLRWLKTQAKMTPKLTRWAAEIDQYDFELKPVKGKYNIVADALSRRLDYFGAIVHYLDIGRDLQEKVREAYAQDPIYSDLLKKVKEAPETEPDYRTIEGLLFEKTNVVDHLYVPNSEEICSLILGECHDTEGHFGWQKTLANLMHAYTWPGMKADCIESVERNGFMGELPNLENVTSLMNLNAHSNQLTGTIPSWIGKLELVMMIDLSSNRLSGGIPESLQNLTNLQVLRLGDNQVNGTIPPSLGHPAQASLRVMWMEQTDLTGPVPSGWTTSDASKLDYAIFETPICEEHPQLGVNRQLCQVRPESSLFSGSSDSAPPFRDFDSERILSLRQQVAKDLNLNETQVQVENFTAAGDRLEMALTFYPPEFRSLNAEEMTMIKDGLYTQKVHLGADLGPYVALNYSLPGALIVKEDKGLSTGETAAIITSAVVGGLIVCVAIMYAYNQKKRADYAEHYPAQAISITVGGDDNEPQIQFKGARIFRFEELKRVTNNFSERNVLGKGGYGKVYKGVLRDGEEVAIKRLDKESQQGDREFSTEVALLLRLHHRNLVNLVGFCTEGPEQMLVYEYMPNGTLNEHLNGSRGRTLTCYERLSIAEGAASGLVYLHVHADPPIIHRDIKPGNILLDSRFVAKVADFGLSKLAPDGGTHLVTTVKGTTGYLDPEYYMNNTLSEKSDVFSFGIVLLELFTGRLPIVNGRHILATVQKALDKDSLYEVIDPRIREKCDFNAIEAGIKIALRCTAPASQDRPTMLEVYEELKAIRGRDSSHVSNDSNRSPVSRDNLKSSGYFSKTAEDEQRVKGNARKDPYESDNWPDTFTSSGVTIVNPDITQIAPR